MDRWRRSLLFLGCLGPLALGSVLSAQTPVSPVSPISPAAADPAALRRDIEAGHLDPARAVALKNVKLAAGLATLRLEEGVLLPASPVGGKTVELVFLGRGRITLEPPDPVEAGQLDLFTGSSRLDAEWKEGVLVVGLDPAVAALLKKPAAHPDAATVERAEALYRQWKAKPERKQLNVETGILGDALGDPAYQGYFAAWFRGGDLGDVLYLIEPDSREQVTLGHFVALEATEKQKRKILRQIEREQRKGRLVGLELDDLGQWDTWLAASLRDKEGKPAPGGATFEPEKYTLDVTVGDDVRLSGRARLDLKCRVNGARLVPLRLERDLAVARVTDGAGAGVFFQRSGRDLVVALPHAVAAGEAVQLVVEYAGNAIDKDWNLYTLLDTTEWYPHAGSVDRARYEVTYHWPKGLDLVAAGKRTEAGEASGLRWERRTIDRPVFGTSFEVGHFKTEEVKAGHVLVTFAFDPASSLGRSGREEVMKAATDALAYYEDLFGPYPMDELTFATAAHRDFSQGMPGLITLADGMLVDLGVWSKFFGLRDRREVVAHELAHQWWGDLIGWASYRDQWISEAMANFCALQYAKARLDSKERGLAGITSGWQRQLTEDLADGRMVESVGPVVLGVRLLSSRSDDAYQAIVYQKGALVLNMLARGLGEDGFRRALGQIVRRTGPGTLSTEELLSLLSQIATIDLHDFSQQFIYGTGLPEVYYNYRFEPKAGGGFQVVGEARQKTPRRFRYQVVKAANSSFDVTRQAIAQVEVAQSALAVPIEIDVYDPQGRGKKAKSGANSAVHGSLRLKGETTPIAIDLQFEPKEFWFDKDSEVFGLFWDEKRNPKQALYFQGLEATAAGKTAAAEALFERALKADDEPREYGGTVYYQDIQFERRWKNARIEIAKARLLLEQGRDADAQKALDEGDMLSAAAEWKLLQSRLEIRRGAYDKAFRRLKKGLPEIGGLDSAEGNLLLAIAARATNHREEYDRAVKAARESGADLALLNESPTKNP
ncbi:MAG TPA: M1 family aminopeptidase [Thermoanaerobaculia bacterium]|nr:M1 family aminopeptidase [Thermoanaerobaculia bacterium]